MKDSTRVVDLIASRDDFIRDSKRGLVRTARRCPESYVAVTIVDGNIDVSWTAMSRLRLIGALHMAIQSLTESGD